MSDDKKDDPPKDSDASDAPEGDSAPSANDDAKSEKDGAYRVGDRHPPPDHMWKKGQSGGGHLVRKRGRGFYTVVEEKQSKLLEVTENGKKKKRPALDVLAQTDMNDALRGNQKSRTRQFEWAEKIEARKEAKAAARVTRNLGPEDEAMLMGYAANLALEMLAQDERADDVSNEADASSPDKEARA